MLLLLLWQNSLLRALYGCSQDFASFLSRLRGIWENWNWFFATSSYLQLRNVSSWSIDLVSSWKFALLQLQWRERRLAMIWASSGPSTQATINQAPGPRMSLRFRFSRRNSKALLRRDGESHGGRWMLGVAWESTLSSCWKQVTPAYCCCCCCCHSLSAC